MERASAVNAPVASKRRIRSSCDTTQDAQLQGTMREEERKGRERLGFNIVPCSEESGPPARKNRPPNLENDAPSPAVCAAFNFFLAKI